MLCPACLTPELVMSDRQGVEIDYCPQCRGVWLDRGELDKIIERTAVEAPRRSAAPDMHAMSVPRRAEYDSDDDYDDRRRPYKKRKSLLREIFDFD